MATRGQLALAKRLKNRSSPEQQEDFEETGKSFTTAQARQTGTKLGIDWTHAPFSVEQFRIGMNEELEHGTVDPQTDVTHDDPILTGKIALAHLKEAPNYYEYLTRMEDQIVKEKG